MNKAYLEEKLKNLRTYIEELKEQLKEGDDGILQDTTHLRAVERVVQLMIDTAIDINTHIIRSKDIKTPDDYFGTFNILGESEVIDSDLAFKIAPSVGLRNALVHAYEKLDVNRMLRDIRSGVEDYKEYMRQISDFIDSQK